MTNEIIKNVITRRSCKKFKSDPVPKEMIDAVIEAGMYKTTNLEIHMENYKWAYLNHIMCQ